MVSSSEKGVDESYRISSSEGEEHSSRMSLEDAIRYSEIVPYGEIQPGMEIPYRGMEHSLKMYSGIIMSESDVRQESDSRVEIIISSSGIIHLRTFLLSHRISSISGTGYSAIMEI